MFLECLESLLGRETEAGFRGVQSKSLMDIIQLECISQSSSVLRITNGPLTGKIWIQDGELIDAEADDLRSEAAFHKILSWKAGNFEMLPVEPEPAPHDLQILQCAAARIGPGAGRIARSEAQRRGAAQSPDRRWRSCRRSKGSSSCWR